MRVKIDFWYFDRLFSVSIQNIIEVLNMYDVLIYVSKSIQFQSLPKMMYERTRTAPRLQIRGVSFH